MIYSATASETSYFNNFRVDVFKLVPRNACRFYPNRYLISSKDRNKLQKIYNGNKVTLFNNYLPRNIFLGIKNTMHSYRTHDEV